VGATTEVIQKSEIKLIEPETVGIVISTGVYPEEMVTVKLLVPPAVMVVPVVAVMPVKP
jgi:hypothetical protein